MPGIDMSIFVRLDLFCKSENVKCGILNSFINFKNGWWLYYSLQKWNNSTLCHQTPVSPSEWNAAQQVTNTRFCLTNSSAFTKATRGAIHSWSQWDLVLCCDIFIFVRFVLTQQECNSAQDSFRFSSVNRRGGWWTVSIPSARVFVCSR